MNSLLRSRTSRPTRRPLAAAVFAIGTLLAFIVPLANAAPARFEQLAAMPSTGPLYVDGGARLLYTIQGGLQSYVSVLNLDTLARRSQPILFDAGLVPFAAIPLRGAGIHMQFTLAEPDVVHHRLFYPYRDGTGAPTVAVIDGLAGKVTKSWTVPAPIPSAGVAFGIESLAYDDATDTLYAIAVTPIAAAANALVGEVYVIAVNATTGASKWSYRVPECTSLFADAHIAPPLGASNGRLYTACGTGTLTPLTGANGIADVIKITLGPNGGAPTGQQTFPAPILPSRAMFDRVNERMYLLDTATLLATFDGAHEAWVGLVDPTARPQMGMDPSIGRVYLCRQKQAKGGGLFSAEAGAAAPVPPGSEESTINCPPLESWPMVVDPVTHKLFVEQAGPGGTALWTVLRDRMPAYVQPVAFDPDQGAEDVAEKEGVTESSFSTQGSAFGTKLVNIGGPLGALQNFSPLIANLVRGEIGHQAQLRLAEGSREVRFARVNAVKMSDAGVEASAIAGDRNNAVDNDFSTLRQHPAVSAVNTNTGNSDPSKAQPQWPYSMAACFTFGGATDTPMQKKPGETSAGTAEANCDFSKLAGNAKADSDRIEVPGVISIGESHASVVSTRDPKLGVLTISTASAKNVVIGGVVSIADITANVMAFAHGRPGSANTQYDRKFSGVRIVQPGSGTPVYSCDTPDTCDPAHVIAAINQVLGPRIVARLPQPSPTLLHGSPKGASASFQQDEWPQTEERLLFDKPVSDLTMPGFELRVEGNVGTASGAIVQLAGVTASAGYRTFKLPEAPNLELIPEPTVAAVVETAPPVYTGQIAPPPVTAAAPTTQLQKISTKVRNGFRLIFGTRGGFRNVMAGWALLLSPLYLGVRRRAFMQETS